MKDRLYVTVAAVALLVAVTLPIFSSVLTISAGRAGGQQTGQAQVARRGADAACQSGHSCGG
jgi:hypothetical protein